MRGLKGGGPELGRWKRFKIRRACRALAYLTHQQGTARHEDIAEACGMFRATARWILHEMFVYGYATEGDKDIWTITPAGTAFLMRWSSLIAKDL
jgi:DNA-binding IclR family transcriptional regulator